VGELEATVFQRYAEYLWRRAGGIVLRWTIGGALAGAGLGAVMLTSWAHWPVPHREAYLLVLLGAVSGAFLGRSQGRTRALGLQLQAQLAAHQLEFERMTLARVAASEAAQAPKPTPAVVRPPAYVPVGVPPVSHVEPAPAGYGWDALETAGSPG
jgi:hypothetical protein